MLPSRLKYRLLRKEDFTGVLEFLKIHFVPHEITHVAVGATVSEVERYDLSKVEHHLQQGLSLGAFAEHGQLCATCISVQVGAEQEADHPQKHSSGKCGIMDRFWNETVGNAGRLQQIIGTEKYTKVRFACVASEYRGQGVYTEILKRWHEATEEKRCPTLVVAVASEHMLRFFQRNGYRVILEQKYADYVDSVTGRREFEGIATPNTRAALLVRCTQ